MLTFGLAEILCVLVQGTEPTDVHAMALRKEDARFGVDGRGLGRKFASGVHARACRLERCIGIDIGHGEREADPPTRSCSLSHCGCASASNSVPS